MKAAYLSMFTQDCISRTAGNEYEKIDKALWMVFPRYEDKRRTSFTDARELIIPDEDPDDDLDKIDIGDVVRYLDAKVS